MGYTSFTVEKLEKIIDKFKPRSVIDLGAQNMFNQPKLPAPYASEWYENKKVDGKMMKYACIDLNGENGALKIDLSKRIDRLEVPFFSELLVDAGTSEHVSGEDGNFSWEAIYNCWIIKHRLLMSSWIMYNENPKSGHWPLHGKNYYTQEFYIELEKISGYKILELGEHPAMGNNIDGYNIFCTLKNVSTIFPSLEQFKKLPLYQL